MLNRKEPFANDRNYIFIDELNVNIAQLNKLIVLYNVATVDKKAELLLEINQHLSYLDSYAGSNDMFHAVASDEFMFTNFINTAKTEIKKEFLTLGLDNINQAAINQWDLNNCKNNNIIPSAVAFKQANEPGYFASFINSESSIAIKKTSRLLAKVNQASLKINTKENYQDLIELKTSLRHLFATEQISNADSIKLRNLIGSINGRLSSILENNHSLNNEVKPLNFALADQVQNTNSKTIKEITNFLSRSQEFNEAKFHEKFNEAIPKLANYQIRFLGGTNSKNYLITDPINQEKFVIKITPFIGNSRQTYKRLKNTSAAAGITKVFAEHSSIDMPDENMIFNLEITEYCNKGNVLSHGANIALAEDKILNAVNLYSQMSELLLNIEANNAFFPDMKPTNFLVDENNNLIIADTKSFVETQNGMFNGAKVNKSQKTLYTDVFTAPEFNPYSDEDQSVDKHHAYLLGLSLYLYLTNTKLGRAQKKADLDFSKNVFKSAKGQQLKELIENLIKDDPQQRISLTQAKERLHNIQYQVKVENSPFKSKPEAYFFAIDHLMELSKQNAHPQIKVAIAKLKILVENHEQDPNVAAEIMKALDDKLNNKPQSSKLLDIANAIETSSYKQTLKEKYENPLGRRFESEMQITLLQQPTTAMMNSVEHMSKSLLNVFEQIEKSDFKDLLDEFSENLTSGKEPTGFGSQPKAINYQQVKEILQNNSPADLNQILFIQFLFAQKFMRNLPNSITMPNQNMPSGKLLEIIKDYNNGEFKEDPTNFFKNMDNDKLKLISNDKIYGSKLFSADNNRGRDGRLINTFTSQMGLMLSDQNQDAIPIDKSSWTPDSKYQRADLDSPTVQDLIENDAVYAAGPSGMTSLFLGIMENYGNFSTNEAKQNYFTAVSAYMVSGGLHSLHEVLAPAQYALELVPGYNVTPPDPKVIAQPQNFHTFYQQQMNLDPEFQERYDQGWDKVMQAYAKQRQNYIHRPIVEIDPKSIIQKITAKESKAKPQKMMNSKLAAKNLIGSIDRALQKYSLDHQGKGIKRAVILLKESKQESDLINVMGKINNFFNSKYKPEYFSKTRANNKSFISFLLNELKIEPELVDYINQHTTDNQIKISPDVDYTLNNATKGRTKAFKAFQEINQENIKPDNFIAMKRELKHNIQKFEALEPVVGNAPKR